MVQVWDVYLQVGSDSDALIPSFDWCVAAYEKLWYRLTAERTLDYPYMVHEQLLRDVHYMSIFEECWKRTDLATQGIKAQDFDPYETRTVICEHVIKFYGTNSSLANSALRRS